MAITIYHLKPAFIALLRPLTVMLARRGVTANHVTSATCLLSCLYGAGLCLFPNSRPLWFGLPLWLFLRMAMNAMDGILAREHGQKSRLGALLNEMGDVVADAALFLPLVTIPGVSGFAVALFVWLALLTEFAGVLALMVDAQRRYDGPMGKSDRAFCIALAGLVMGAALQWQWHIGRAMTAALWLCCCLMVLTTYNRLRHALAEERPL